MARVRRSGSTETMTESEWDGKEKLEKKGGKEEGNERDEEKDGRTDR